MSLFHADHFYRVVVQDAQDARAQTQFLSHNCRSVRIPMGTQTEVQGKYLRMLETKGVYLPVSERDPETGMERFVRRRWMPRFNIHTIADITASKGVSAAPVPSGGVLLEKPSNPSERMPEGSSPATESAEDFPEPKSEKTGRPSKANAKAVAKATSAVDFAPTVEDEGSLSDKGVMELRAMCAAQNIRCGVNSTKEEMLLLLTK